MVRPSLLLTCSFACLLPLFVARSTAAEATFCRALNLNGPAIELDGRAWEGTNAANVVVTGKTFENHAVPLKPTTDPPPLDRFALPDAHGAARLGEIPHRRQALRGARAFQPAAILLPSVRQQ